MRFNTTCINHTVFESCIQYLDVAAVWALHSPGRGGARSGAGTAWRGRGHWYGPGFVQRYKGTERGKRALNGQVKHSLGYTCNQRASDALVQLLPFCLLTSSPCATWMAMCSSLGSGNSCPGIWPLMRDSRLVSINSITRHSLGGARHAASSLQMFG